MALITHHKLDEFLAAAGDPAPVYLIFGEPYICQQAFQKLVDRLVPEEHRSFSLDVLDESENDIYEAIERVNTFSLDAEPRVVGLCDSRIFYSKVDDSKLIGQIKDALADEKPDRAAAVLMKLLALLDLDINSLGPEEKERILAVESDAADKQEDWLEPLLDYCRQAEYTVPSASDPAAALQLAIEKGFAPANHLVITTDLVDKRRKLFKTIKERGQIIDCSVAGGDSKAARQDQQAALAEMTRTVMARWHKTLAPQAFKALCETTGFDPGTFHNNLEKLATYVGQRDTITVEDVKHLSSRTRTDPVYALTNAVFAQDRHQSLFYLESLLSGKEAIHPLQVLASILNQTRKLLIIRDFMDQVRPATWQEGLPFDAFKRKVLPAIEKYDAETAAQIKKRDEFLAGEDGTTTPSKKKAKKKQPPADLLLASGAPNPYPIFKNFEKAALFSKSALLSIFFRLRQADRRLKTISEKDPAARFILEELVIEITGDSAAKD